MEQQQFGRYEIVRELGRGGMATVYLANDPRLDTEVALKLLPAQFTHDPTFRGRFEREARIIAALRNHPAVVPIYDFGEADDQPFLVMRYLEGGTLADLLARKGALTLDETLPTIQRIGSALDAAHEKGIIHRDLKPANVLLDNDGLAYLSDFGIVGLAESSRTFTGNALIGTPAYMSPEQISGDMKLDGRSDIYTLSIILYEMLTGRPPYQADTTARMLMAHVLQPVPRIVDANHRLPMALQAVIARGLAKDRDERYASAADLVHDLEIIARAAAMPSPPPPDLNQTMVEQPQPATKAPTPVPVPVPVAATAPSAETPTTVETRPRPIAAPPPPPPPADTKKRTPVWLFALIGLAVLLAGGLFAGSQLLGGSEPEPEQELVVLVATSTPTTTPTAEPDATEPPPTDEGYWLSADEIPPLPTDLPDTADSVPVADTSPEISAETDTLQLPIDIASAAVREGPSPDHARIRFAYRDEVFDVLARDETSLWLQVALPADEGPTTGWIAVDAFDVADDSAIAALPLADDAPTPPAAPLNEDGTEQEEEISAEDAATDTPAQSATQTAGKPATAGNDDDEGEASRDRATPTINTPTPSAPDAPEPTATSDAYPEPPPSNTAEATSYPSQPTTTPAPPPPDPTAPAPYPYG